MNSLISINNYYKPFTTPSTPTTYSSAQFYFSLNGNLNNAGTDTSQTMSSNSSTFSSSLGKTVSALYIAYNTNRVNTITPINISYSANSNGSISFFVYPTSYIANNYASYFYYNVNASTGGSTGLRICLIKNNSNYYFVFGQNGGSENVATVTISGNELALNMWSQICVVWSVNSDATSGTAKLYINATLKNTVTVTNWSNFNSTSVTPNRLWSLGVEQTTGSGNSNLSAYYANFAYWSDKALSTTEMTTIANAFT